MKRRKTFGRRSVRKEYDKMEEEGDLDEKGEKGRTNIRILGGKTTEERSAAALVLLTRMLV